MDRPRPRPAASLEAAMVARRFYLDDRQKNEIAQELGISRFKVARLLDEARESGIVRIHIDVPTDVDLELGDAVARRFGVARVVPVRALDEDDRSLLPVVGAAAAQVLEGALGPDDVLGLSWGQTLTSTVEAFAVPTASDVVQVVGGINAGSAEIGGVELVRRMAAATGGRAYPLNAPFVLGSAAIAAALRTDPSLADAMGRFPSLTVAALGIGSWNPPRSAVAATLSPTEREEIARLGIAADMCGFLFDDTGAEVASPLSGRTVGVTLDELRRIPEVVAIAAGPDKTAAIAAALRTGIVSTLVTDAFTARRLLAL